MQTADLCLPWYWQYDVDFVQYIDEACQSRGLTLWTITPQNLIEAVNDLYTGGRSFRTLLDRAADDLRFEPIRRFALNHHLLRINPLEVSHWAEDKATMHLELIQAGLQTPYTLLIAPFVEQPLLPALDLSPLGEKFVLKPAVGGGGEGVRMNASTRTDIQKARLEYPNQKYLAQAQIEAQVIAGRAAWFRVFYVDGDTLPCWWHPLTHIYKILTPEEEQQYQLSSLHEVTQKIGQVCRLDWFSTEIALTADGRFVVVDYVNDSIDTRLQSKAMDGMPDEIMKRITCKLVDWVVLNKKAGDP